MAGNRDNDPFVVVPTYGRELIPTLPAALHERPIVITQPEPWPLVAPHFDEEKTQLCMPESMSRAVVESTSMQFGPASAVFGIGGGAALDQAKHTAWKRDLPLVLVPSILSVDAAFTAAIAVREDNRVRYIGQAEPERLLIDYGLLQSAPSFLNHSGAGDILSIYTALWDWKQAASRIKEPYDETIAEEASALLDRLYRGVGDLRRVTEAGLHLLGELYRDEVRLCLRAGSARPEEGSEHYLAYCLEALTGRGFLHGRLIGMCVQLVADYQGQDPRPVREFLRELTLDCSPKALGVSDEELGRALRGMKDFLEQETQLLPGVFHFFPDPSDRQIDAMVRAVEAS